MHKAVKDNDLDELTRLLSSGANVDERDSLNRTALHLAAWRGHAVMIDMLLKSKADVLALAQDGYSALHFAVNAGSLEAVEVLMRKNMNAQLRLKLNKNKRTALHLAAAKNLRPIVEFLLSRGADPLALTKSGESPADLAVDREVIDAIVSKCQEVVQKQRDDLLAIDKRPVVPPVDIIQAPPPAPAGVSENVGQVPIDSARRGSGADDKDVDDVSIEIKPLKRKLKPLFAPPKIKLGHLDDDEDN